jgi:hypothetical protein
MDYKILDLFLKENDAWEDMIARQTGELPKLDKLITRIVEEKPMRGESAKVFKHLKRQMEDQAKHMSELVIELEKQQRYLHEQRKRKNEDPHSINTFFSQKILRERIRDVERNFVELKCNYLNYIATI